MSFSGGVREEIAQIIPSGRQAMETSAAALLANIGTVYREDDGTLWLRLSAGNPIAFRKCFTLILKNVNIRPDLFGRRFSSEWAGWRWKGNSRGKALSSLLLPVGHKAVRAISREDTAPDSGKDSGKKEAVQTGEEASGDRTASAEPGGKLSDGCPVPAEAGERPSGSSRPLPGGPVEGTTGNRKMSAEADAKTAGAGLQNVEQLAEPLEALLRRLRILRADGVVREQDGTVPQELVRGTRARAYLREMFLCCGFMSDPAARYHLEFRCSSLPQAEQLQGILEQDGIISGRTRRRNYQVVYIKESESIVRLLQLMGASVNVMATENARILKELRNNVNRQVNCETANIGKTVESAARQREDIRLLRERGILQTLPAQLQEAAALREEYPGASLSELGKLTDPPVGRSGMNHRMRKLSALAQKAGQEGN